MDLLRRKVPSRPDRPPVLAASGTVPAGRHGTKRAARAVAARFSRRAPLDWTALDHTRRRRCAAGKEPTSRFGVGFLLPTTRMAQEGILAPFWTNLGGQGASSSLRGARTLLERF